MADNPLLLVYDIGTTGLKCSAFDTAGKESASVPVPYRTLYPAPGWAEQEAADYWSAAVEGTRWLVSDMAVRPRQVAAIGLSGHMNGCLAVDAGGNPLCREIIHADSRSGAECAEILRGKDPAGLYALTGNRVDEHLSLPKILWLKNHLPDVYARTAFFLNSKDYLRFRLTGIPGETDYSDASLVNAMDLRAGCWAEAYIRELGLDPGKFPAIRKGIDLAGTLTREAGSALGLPAGIPVSIGGGDAACATRGAGVRDSRSAYACLGSSAWISTLVPDPLPDPKRRMQNFYDLDGDACNVCGTVQSAGSAVDWAVALVAGSIGGTAPEPDFRTIERAVESVSPGSDGVIFLPYLMGERTPYWDASARGSFVGFSLYHGSAALLRSVYEGVVFALKDVLNVYDDLGLPVRHLTLLGGGARSSVWRDIIRDVLGCPVSLHSAPASATSLGAAMAAGVGVGLFPDLGAASAIASREPAMEPSLEAAAAYGKLYPVFRSLYGRLKPVYDELVEAVPQTAGHDGTSSS